MTDAVPKLETLSAERLREEQDLTMRTPRRKYGVAARLLFATMDVFYGKAGSLAKYRVLEVIARVPYQAWEHVAYIAITHIYRRPDFARRIFERVKETREQQDNEQFHLLIFEELTHRQAGREGFIRYRIIPQILAFVYYQLSWLLYVVKPGWSYRLNADFEDHAEHEYMQFVADNPQLEELPHEGCFEEEYGQFDSIADLIRQIGYDERVHKLESVARMSEPRFR